MKMVIGLGLVIGSLLWVPSAEAARCKKGQVYRPSLGVCQSKQAAVRAGVYRRSSGAARRSKIRPPKPKPAPVIIQQPAQTQSNWIVDYYTHVNDWAVKNRNSIIRSLGDVK